MKRVAIAAGIAMSLWVGDAGARSIGRWNFPRATQDELTGDVTTKAFVGNDGGALTVLCVGAKPMVTLSAPQFYFGGSFEGREVNYRIDDGPLLRASWRSSDDTAAIFDDDAMAFAKSLTGARKLVVRAYAFDEDSVTLTLDLNGSGQAIPAALGVCAH